MSHALKPPSHAALPAPPPHSAPLLPAHGPVDSRRPVYIYTFPLHLQPSIKHSTPPPPSSPPLLAFGLFPFQYFNPFFNQSTHLSHRKSHQLLNTHNNNNLLSQLTTLPLSQRSALDLTNSRCREHSAAVGIARPHLAAPHLRVRRLPSRVVRLRLTSRFPPLTEMPIQLLWHWHHRSTGMLT